MNSGELGASDERGAHSSLRPLLATLALSALGGLGALPSLSSGAGDPAAFLAWVALLAPAAGAFAVHLQLSPLPWGAAAPSSWVLGLVWCAAASPRIVPTPLWGAAAWMGLFALGAAGAQLWARRDLKPTYVAALASLALASAAWAPGRAGAPWSPDVTALWLDLSPLTLVAECAGLDWMRTPLVYDAAQTDRLERVAWRGELAGPLCLLVGYASWALARRVRSSEPST